MGCRFINDNLATIPTDEELRKIFEKNRPKFDELVTMSDRDSKLLRIDYDFTWIRGESRLGQSGTDSSIGFTQERWDRYKALFTELDIRDGLTRSEQGTYIELAFVSKGLAVGGIQKGLAFSRDKSECGSDSLDDISSLSGSKYFCKALDENWRIFVSR